MKNKQLPVIILILYALARFSPVTGQYRLEKPIEIEKEGIAFTVLPQVELISVVQTVSKYPSVMSFLMTRDSTTYLKDVFGQFRSFKDHEVVKMFDRLSQQPGMLNFSAPSNLMLYTDRSLGIRKDIETDQFVLSRIGGTDSLKRFLELLGDFARVSSFNKFFKDHKPFYDEIINKTVKSLGEHDYIDEIEKFYGSRQRSYSVVLVSLYGPVGFGNSLLYSDGKREIFNTMGPRSVSGDRPFFGDELYLAQLIRHEFSHPFVNPLTEKYWNTIKDYSGNYLVIPETARKNVCGDWQECINEFIIRSVTTYMASTDSEESGMNAFNREKSRGVSLLEDLIGKLKEYQASREEYPTFDSYYQIILDVFREIK